MAAEIIEDDDISLPQDGQEQLLDIGAKALFADRTVEDAGCGDPSQRNAPRKVRVRHRSCGAGLPSTGTLTTVPQALRG